MPFAAGSPEIVRYASRTYDAMRVPSSYFSNHTIYGLNRYWPMGSRTPPDFGVYILDRLPPHFLHDLFQGSACSPGKGIGGITIGAAQVAAGQSDEYAGQTCKGAFPLQA